MKKRVPVINLFAGAGGLAEGFCPVGGDGDGIFEMALAIEKNPDACRTLLLRNFCRQFPGDELPVAYYHMLRGEKNLHQLFEAHPSEASMAAAVTVQAELGNSESLHPEDINRMIRERVAESDDWVLIGGPPCQAYSKAGRSRNKGICGYSAENDPRFFLYREYLKVLGLHEPSVFVLENVLGLISAKVDGERIFPQMLEDLANPGKAIKKGGTGSRYRLYTLFGDETDGSKDPMCFVVRCEELGLPQTRHRVIVIGVRDDIRSNPGAMEGVLHPAGMAGYVLQGLPPLRSGISRGRDDADSWKAVLQEALSSNWILESEALHGVRVADAVRAAVRKAEGSQLMRGGDWVPSEGIGPGWMADWYVDPRLEGALNHSTKEHMPGDLHRYLFAAAFAGVIGHSPMLQEFPENLLPKHRNALSGKFPDRFRVQLVDKPSKTITSHISQDGHYFIHPEAWQCRSLTVREAARLQTFPDNYFFTGNKVAQYIQVGNAVPPLLAWVIKQQIEKIVRVCPD